MSVNQDRISQIYVITSSFLIEALASLQTIYDILEKIEIAITFSKLNTFHNSIVDPKELLNSIEAIETQMNGGRLPA